LNVANSYTYGRSIEPDVKSPRSLDNVLVLEEIALRADRKRRKWSWFQCKADI
jgi:hypothetical protein